MFSFLLDGHLEEYSIKNGWRSSLLQPWEKSLSPVEPVQQKRGKRWILVTVFKPWIKSYPELGIYSLMVYLLFKTFATVRCQINMEWGNSSLIVNKSVLHHQKLEWIPTIFWSPSMHPSFITTNVELASYGDVNVLFFKGMFDRMKGSGISMILTPLKMGGQPIIAISMGMKRHIL